MTDLRQRLMDEVERDPPVGIGAIVMRLGVDLREAEAELRAMAEEGLVIGRGGLWGPAASVRVDERPPVRVTTTRLDDQGDDEDAEDEETTMETTMETETTPTRRPANRDDGLALLDHERWQSAADVRAAAPHLSNLSGVLSSLARERDDVERRQLEDGRYAYRRAPADDDLVGDEPADQAVPGERAPRATAEEVRRAVAEAGGWVRAEQVSERLPGRRCVAEVLANVARSARGIERRGKRGSYEYRAVEGWRYRPGPAPTTVQLHVETWGRLCASLGMEPSADVPTAEQAVEAAEQRLRGAAEDGATYRERLETMRDRIIRLLGLEGRDRDVSDYDLHLQLGQEFANLRGSVDALRDTHDRYGALRAALVSALPTGDAQDSDYQLVAEVRTRIRAALRIEEGWRSARTSLGNLQSSWRLLCELLELPERSPWKAVRDRITEHLKVQSDQDSTLSGIAAKLGVRRDCDILSAVVDLHKQACVLEEQRDDARRLLDRPRRAEVPDAITGPLSVEDLTASDLRRAWRVASAVAAAGLGATPDALGALAGVLYAAERRGQAGATK